MKQQKIKTLTIINFNSLMLMVFDCSPFLYRYRLWNSDNENARSYSSLKTWPWPFALSPPLLFLQANQPHQTGLGGCWSADGRAGEKTGSCKTRTRSSSVALYFSLSQLCVRFLLSICSLLCDSWVVVVHYGYFGPDCALPYRVG